MSLTRQIATIKAKLDIGEPVDSMLEAVAANLEDCVKQPSFFSLPYETIETIVSKRAGQISVDTADELLHGTSLKYGKRVISLLQFINCGAIGYANACSLVKCIADCPLIAELMKGKVDISPVTTPKSTSSRGRRNSLILTPPRSHKKKESECIMQSEDINALKRANANIIDELEDFIGQIESEETPRQGASMSIRQRRAKHNSQCIENPNFLNTADRSENDIFQAIVDDNIRDVERIIKKDRSEVNNRNADNNYPIHVAAKKGRASILQLLVNNGADVNQKGYSFLCPIHFAADFNYPDIIQFLLSKGANIEAKSGWIPLYFYLISICLF